ncbi:MAG: alpha/beta hydrolase [Myxococcota bacterium]|nr:alpha/beta hydrolase [Myxococcota bacterium]
MARPSLVLALVLGYVTLALAPAAAAPARKLAPRWETLPLPPAMPKATTTGFVDRGGGRIYYATYGKGPPVILLHGGLGNADHFAHQVPALVAHRTVIAIDSRGQGRSTLGTQRLTYHVMAGDVLAVMDHLKLDRAALVGWSDGGAIALDLAIHEPTRVERLFVFGTNFNSAGRKPRKGTSSRTFAAYAAKCRKDYQQLSKTPKRYAAVVASLLPIWRSPGGFTKAQIRTITAPAVIAVGDHDEIILQDHLEEMVLLMPAARLVVFAATSHFALWQDPASFNAALVEFLQAP